MKLVRFGEIGQEKPGIFLDGSIYDVSSITPEDFGESFFDNNGIARLKQAIDTEKESLPIVKKETRIAPAIYKPSKIICVGLNYADHAKETNTALPKEPILFLKSTTALTGPFDEVIIPKGSLKTDWEVELAVVIGKKASYVPEEKALEYVAGYCLHNDISEREYQLERGGQWDKGKGCDTFAPMGPYLVTPDEIIDVNNLDVWLCVDNKKYQQSNTSNLIFKVPYLISYISQFMTLLPGDIISTGTPGGVGLGLNPQIYLKPGDVMELGIEGLGISRQVCKAYAM